MENNLQQFDHSKSSNRLLFIDVMRAYAILMMVQGHMIDALIDPVYRDSSIWLFSLWDHMRGVTAPVFFFSSGTIFSYLLLRKNLPIRKNERFFKGMKRVGILLLLGYLLRFNPSMLLNLENFDFLKYKSAFAVDALHCIAVGLGLILVSYFLHRITKVWVWVYYFIFAFTAFFLYPNVADVNWLEILPLPMADYLTRDYGSNFPVIPWTGFVMWGALLGYLLSKRVNFAFNNIFAIVMLVLGLLLHYYSGSMLDFFYRITSLSNFDYLNNHNFLYFHLGNALIVLGVLAFISNIVKIPSLLSSIGKSTMMIYVVHVFIIYGTGFNLGLQYYYGKSLTPVQAVLSAVGIELFFIMLVYYWAKLEPVMQEKFPKIFPKKRII
ncbi:hypothetical protein MASR1M45_09320 [Candidatus Kapaibacterium sp.]